MKLQSLTASIVLTGCTVWVLGSNGLALATPIAPEAGSATQVLQADQTFTITGGTPSGDGQTLFHSFQQFGLTPAQVATFLTQPEVQAILGRVVGGEASYINGLLQVTGSSADLYLVNPAGILLGANAQLDLSGSFAATTASGIQFGDAIFHAGGNNAYAQLVGTPTGYIFAANDAGAVVNAANLAVFPGESITLIGGQVLSMGTLTAPGGTVTIAAIPTANLVRISQSGMALNLELAALPAGAMPINAFTPLALPELLTGAGAEIATGLVVNSDGTIALVNTETDIATAAGTAIAAGRLDVAGATGGAVTVVGDRVGLLNATVDASGMTGGGTIRIGGDYQGQPTLPGSRLTYLDQDSTLLANGGLTGDGGRIILWADGVTAFAGAIAATGGTLAGDGGFVEVSGAQSLAFRGEVDTSAPQGAIGTLLLDPVNIIILNGPADGDDTDALNTLLSEPTVVANTLGPPVDYAIYESELAGLDGNVNLVLQASNNITIADLADNELSFALGNGSITFQAGNAFQMLDVNDLIFTPGRNLTITAATITAGNFSTQNIEGGTVRLQATNAVNVGNIRTDEGDIVISGSNVRTGNLWVSANFGSSPPDANGLVQLTSTTEDVMVNTIIAGGGGVNITAARQFQAVGSQETLLSTRLESATDGDLIQFLSKGNPSLLVDAGLVDGPNLDPFQSSIFIPMSVIARPDDSGQAPIAITHGGQANTITSGGGLVTIQGTGAYPNLQFITGPNADHTIQIFNAGTNSATATFDNFSTIFPAGTFAPNASGAIGAIVRQNIDSTLITSFQNIPFAPIDVPADPTLPPTPPGTGNPSAGGNNPVTGFSVNTTGLEQLTPDRETAEVEPPDDDAAAIAPADAEAETCSATITQVAAASVEITNACESSAGS